MSAVVSLQEFVNEMDTMGDDWTVFLNRRTGEFRNVSDEELRAAEGEMEVKEDEENDEVEDDDDMDVYDRPLPEWQREAISKAREVMESDDWLTLPGKWEIHEYAIMERFCRAVEDNVLRADLLDAIHGSGAFGRFKSMAGRHGLLEQWYAFRQQAFERIARTWLEANEIAYRP